MTEELDDRSPLRVEVLRERLVAQHRWAAVDVVDSTGSTNTDLAEAARRGAADRTVLLAEEQTAGRGRQRRTWSSPRGAGLYLSVLLRPAGVPLSRWSWAPLLAGVVLAEVVQELTGVEAAVKWPNDLLAGPRRAKCAGILAEAAATQSDPALVIGVGVNVNHRAEELPVLPGGLPPTSLAIEARAAGGSTSPVRRQDLAVEFLRHLATAEAEWRRLGGDPVRTGLWAAYREVCATLGQRVRVVLPNDTVLVGVAEDVDSDGQLVVREDSGGVRTVSAGDVVHVRPEAASNR